jgi:hypothetical protein
MDPVFTFAWGPLPNNVIQSFRVAEDTCNVNNCLIGECPYSVWLVTVTNDQISFNQTAVSRLVQIQRITIGGAPLYPNGYNNTLIPGDGYCNPIIKQDDNTVLTMANGQLNADKLRIGPICFPYLLDVFNGGTDPIIFQPARGQATNTQNYIQVLGLGLAPTGNLFRIERLDVNMNGIFYHLVLTSAGISVLGEVQ